jgi:hypothetical protein
MTDVGKVLSLLVFLLIVALVPVLFAGCPPVPVAKAPEPTDRWEVVSAQRISTMGHVPFTLIVVRDTQTGQDYVAVQSAGQGHATSLTPLLKGGE